MVAVVGGLWERVISIEPLDSRLLNLGKGCRLAAGVLKRLPGHTSMFWNLWPSFLGAQPCPGFLGWVCLCFWLGRGWRDPRSHPARAHGMNLTWAWAFKVPVSHLFCVPGAGTWYLLMDLRQLLSEVLIILGLFCERRLSRPMPVHWDTRHLRARVRGGGVSQACFHCTLAP